MRIIIIGTVPCGLEAASRAIYDGEELTLWYPGIVNSSHPSEQEQ